MHSRAQFPLQVLLLTAALCLGVAHSGHASNMTFEGSITGTFSAPVLFGNLVNADKTPGMFLNNSNMTENGTVGTNTAVFTFTSTGSSTTFTWGACIVSTGCSTAKFTSSSFEFTGVTDTGPVTGGLADSAQQFKLGDFKYINGESDLTTLVFGVTLTLQFTALSGPQPPDRTVHNL